MTTRTPPAIAVDDLPWIIAAEFDDEPGLHLTFPQVKAVWGLSTQECANVLDYLVTTGELVEDEDGFYCRPWSAYPGSREEWAMETAESVERTQRHSYKDRSCRLPLSSSWTMNR